MESIQRIIDQIPIKYDLASHIMFLGIVQGLFLSLVIFLRTKRDSAIYIFGWGLLFQGLVFADTYLCYTGLMKYMLHFNDSTEVFVLMIAPSVYFFIYALLERKPVTFKKIWPHLLVPVLYGLSQINYYLSPIEVKLNAYVDAYHSYLGFVDVPEPHNYGYHHIKDRFRWLVLGSMLFYLLLSARLVFKSKHKKGLSPKNVKIDKYLFSRNTLFFRIFYICINKGVTALGKIISRISVPQTGFKIVAFSG